jgi:RND family efflux transporter MFP subunit
MNRWTLILGTVILGLAHSVAAVQPLATATAEYREVPRQHRLDGAVEAVHQSTVSAQTRGQVEEILFDVDDFVEKDSVIIRLKDKEQKAQAARAAADLKEANAGLQEASEEYNRIKSVFAKRLVSQAAMDKASTALKAAKARRDAAKAGVMQAQEQFEYTLVRAPYSGIVTHRHIELGETANPGQRLMSGISLDQLRVTVDVPQSLIPAVRHIGKASVQPPGGSYIPAEKLTIFPFADHGSNTFKVRLDLPKRTQGLFPGMFVKTAFVVGARQLLLIPTEAVVYRSEVTGVYVVATSGKVSLRHIRTGHKTEDSMIAILAGLDEGEQVALDPIAAGTLLKQQLAEKPHE